MVLHGPAHHERYSARTMRGCLILPQAAASAVSDASVLGGQMPSKRSVQNERTRCAAGFGGSG